MFYVKTAYRNQSDLPNFDSKVRALVALMVYFHLEHVRDETIEASLDEIKKLVMLARSDKSLRDQLNVAISECMGNA